MIKFALSAIVFCVAALLSGLFMGMAAAAPFTANSVALLASSGLCVLTMWKLFYNLTCGDDSDRLQGEE